MAIFPVFSVLLAVGPVGYPSMAASIFDSTLVAEYAPASLPGLLGRVI
jgi:hypothetical protein